MGPVEIVVFPPAVDLGLEDFKKQFDLCVPKFARAVDTQDVFVAIRRFTQKYPRIVEKFVWSRSESFDTRQALYIPYLTTMRSRNEASFYQLTEIVRFEYAQVTCKEIESLSSNCLSRIKQKYSLYTLLFDNIEAIYSDWKAEFLFDSRANWQMQRTREYEEFFECFFEFVEERVGEDVSDLKIAIWRFWTEPAKSHLA